MPRVEPLSASRFAGDFLEIRIPVGCQANEEAQLERDRSKPAVVLGWQAFSRGEMPNAHVIQENSAHSALDTAGSELVV